MKEIRDIKIDLVMGNKNPIVDLFREITKDLQIINCDVYNKDGMEFIYFVPTKSEDNSECEWIFYQDCKKNEFWCNYTKYWSFFESNLRLEYQEIQGITKYLVEEALKREVGTPRKRNEITWFMVEEALKREVGTPRAIGAAQVPPVEEALKREVGTPSCWNSRNSQQVEEALKREVGTPVFTSPSTMGVVEEALKREIKQTE